MFQSEPPAAPDGALAAARLSVATDPALFDEPLTLEAAVPRDRDSVAVEIAPADGAPASSLRAPAVDGLARFDVPPRTATIAVR